MKNDLGVVGELAEVEGLVMWVIYERPRDFPDHFVLRRWVGETPSPTQRLAYSLEQARELLSEVAPGLTNIGRMPSDEPQIVEVWL